MRTRLFLRTAEFLVAGRTYGTCYCCGSHCGNRQMLDVYADFAENCMAMPVIKGVKSANERFAGAEDTYCIEAIMQDGKHYRQAHLIFWDRILPKLLMLKFSDKENKLEYVWATSWGVSTRLIGALVMAHSDDDGLVLPPKVAPFAGGDCTDLQRAMSKSHDDAEKVRCIVKDLKHWVFQ